MRTRIVVIHAEKTRTYIYYKTHTKTHTKMHLLASQDSLVGRFDSQE